MKDLLLPLLHLAVTAAKLCRPGGVRAVIAENLLLKQQLIVLRRSRQRAPNLRVGDRLLCGFGALFLSPGRIRMVAIGLRPSTLLTFHQALVRGKYRRLFSSSARPKKPGPKGPSESLIRASVELKSRNPRFGVPADCAHHLADVRGRHRQERRAPRAGENAIVPPRAEPGPRGCRSSDTRQTVCGAWTSCAVRPSCSRATGCSWSWTSSRGASWDSVCIADRFDAPSLGRMCNAAIHGRGAPRHLSTDHDPLFEAHRWTANLRLLEIDEIKTVPPCAPVTPLCGTADRDDAARIPGSCVVLECR